MIRKNQTRSLNRSRTLGEVFTADREINDMLNMVEENAETKISTIDTRVLEPACGNGNFLENILRRKLSKIFLTKGKGAQTLYEYSTLIAVSSIYGIDIDESNVLQARERMFNTVISVYSGMANTERPHEGYLKMVRYVLSTNIVVGDTINQPNDIVLVKYVPLHETKSFVREIKTLNDALYEDVDFARATLPPAHYLDLADENFSLKAFTSTSMQYDLFNFMPKK